MGQTHLAGAVAVPLMSDSRDSHPQPPSKRVCPQGRASRAGDRAQAGGRVGKGCVCVSVCPCVSVRASLGLYVYAYMCTCVRASTCVYICVHVRVYLRVCVCGAVCGWVCVCGKTCLSGFSGQGARPLSLLCGLATGVSQPLSALCPHQTSPLAGHAPARLPHRTLCPGPGSPKFQEVKVGQPRPPRHWLLPAGTRDTTGASPGPRSNFSQYVRHGHEVIGDTAWKKCLPLRDGRDGPVALSQACSALSLRGTKGDRAASVHEGDPPVTTPVPHTAFPSLTYSLPPHPILPGAAPP